MTITGLHDLATHLVTIFLIWLAIILINWVAKRNILKSMQDERNYRGAITNKVTAEQFNKKQEIIQFVSFVVNRTVGTLAVIFAIITVLFLYNPMERHYEEVNKIGSAVHNENSKEPSKESINITNKEVMNRKSKENKQKAEKENTEAIEKAFELFNKIEKESGK